MRAVKIVTHISLDGVVQHSDDDDGFPYGAWSFPYRSDEGLDMLLSEYGETFDVLLGRRTYDTLATYWPTAPSSPMTDRINAGTKYVVTHRPEGLEWGPAEAVGPDLVEGIRKIKEQDGPNIIVTGSTTVTSPLIESGLVDQVVLIVNPILLGTGKKLFADGAPARAMELVDSKSLPTGLVVNVFENPGPLKS